jgi:ubiquitin-conjugating enzyme E2 Q
MSSMAPKPKRQKSTSAGKMTLLNTAVSDDDELKDITFLFSDDEVHIVNNKGKDAAKTNSKSKEKSGWSFSFGSKKGKEIATRLTDFIPGSLDQESLPMMQEPQYATPSATMRLNRELQTVLKVQASTPSHELGWYINSDLISNVYQWIVELHSFPAELPLAQDMKKAGMTSIVLEIRFGKDYPMSPPFVRIIRPRFLPFTQGGGGHVTGGGAMCMELLTNSGWSAVSSIEGVLLQVRLAIQNLEPKPARLLSTTKNLNYNPDYSTGEAIDAYKRACMAHGWEIPKDFNEFATGTNRDR